MGVPTNLASPVPLVYPWVNRYFGTKSFLVLDTAKVSPLLRSTYHYGYDFLKSHANGNYVTKHGAMSLSQSAGPTGKQGKQTSLFIAGKVCTGKITCEHTIK